MILEEIQNLFTLQNVVMLAFFTVAIWFNYRAGFINGIAYGADASLSMLEHEGIIALEEQANGDYIIRSGDNKSKVYDA
jgi:hypothetical protein